MSKYVIDESTLKGLADALREVTGEKNEYTPVEMIDEVTHILEKGIYLLVDDKGTEIPATFVDNNVVFTATANDIRLGTVAATESGVTEGEKYIPSYNTSEGGVIIPAGGSVKVTGLKNCEYTKLQALICLFNSTISNSVATEKVSIEGSTYPVNSTVALAEVTVNPEDLSIDFGITNESDSLQIVRYFTYKEIY